MMHLPKRLVAISIIICIHLLSCDSFMIFKNWGPPKSPTNDHKTIQSRDQTIMLLRNFFINKLPKMIDNDPQEAQQQLNPTLEQANSMLLLAQKLREEARILEMELQSTKSIKKIAKDANLEIVLNRIFNGTDGNFQSGNNSHSVAIRLRDDRYSEDDLKKLIESIYQKQAVEIELLRIESVKQVPGNYTDKSRLKIGKEYFTSDGYVKRQAAIHRFSFYLKYLTEAATILDELTQNDIINQTSIITEKKWKGKGSDMVNSLRDYWYKVQESERKRTISLSEMEWKQQQKKNSSIIIQEYMTNSNTDSSATFTGSKSISTTSRTSNVDLSIINNVTTVSMIPMWVPSSLLGFVADATRQNKGVFDATDIRTIKESVLTKSRFYCTSSAYISCAAIFRGNIRPANSLVSSRDRKELRTLSATTFNEIQKEMDKQGLSKRIQLFLLDDPEWRTDRETRGDSKPKPVILALPKTMKPEELIYEQTLVSSLLKQAAVALTLCTTFCYSVSCYALNPTIFDAIINKQDMRVLMSCSPIFIGVFGIQLFHEVAHRIVAKIRGMKLGLPLPLPSTHLGTFGSITPFRSFPPDRSALLDVALSGPIAAILLSTVLMIFGSYRTLYATQETLRRFPFVPVAMLKSSFLASSILTYMLPKAMMVPMSQPIPIHPLFLVGFSGVLASALNLLPIFRLDGGRACTAVVGPRIGALTSAWTLLSLLSLAMSGSGLAWAWGGFVLLFQRRTEIPARDEVTSVGDVRTGVWIFSLLIAIMALAPFPGGMGMM